MADRRRLHMGARLLAVREVARLAADAALAAAAAAEEAARTEEKIAQERSHDAQREWSAHLERDSFSPEFGRALAARLVDRHAEHGEAAHRAERKISLHAARRQEWQEAEASLRLARQSLRKLRRRLGQKNEENRLAEMNDRMTYDWSRR